MKKYGKPPIQESIDLLKNYDMMHKTFAVPKKLLMGSDKFITATETLSILKQADKGYLEKWIKQIEKKLIHPAIKIAYKIILQQAVKEKFKIYELKMIKTM